MGTFLTFFLIFWAVCFVAAMIVLVYEIKHAPIIEDDIEEIYDKE